MSELDDAVAALGRAVARLEAAPARGRRSLAAEADATAARAAEDERRRALAGTILVRIDGALGRIAGSLGEEG